MKLIIFVVSKGTKGKKDGGNNHRKKMFLNTYSHLQTLTHVSAENLKFRALPLNWVFKFEVCHNLKKNKKNSTAQILKG